MCTRRLTPSESSTQVGLFLTKPPQNSSEEVRQLLQSAMENGFAGLKSYIEQDIKSEKITAS
jgi:hypothetical protein